MKGEEPIPARLLGWLSEEHGVTNLGWIVAQRQEMCDWALATGRTYKDWEAGFRNWLRRSLEDAQKARGRLPGEEEEAALREWLRIHPVEVPAELEALEADDMRAFNEAMAPVRAAHRERGLAEVRRAQMRSVQ